MEVQAVIDELKKETSLQLKDKSSVKRRGQKIPKLRKKMFELLEKHNKTW